MLKVFKVKNVLHIEMSLEYKLDGYFVDAKGNHHAMEFNGCWYHGCPRCYPNDRDILQVMGKTMQQRYVETLKKKSTTTIGINSS